MDLTGFIAKRYLFAKKSHNVINIISMISAAGIATGCAALIIILSIYNGFDSIVRSLYSSHTPDLLVTPAKGKVFDAASPAILSVKEKEWVREACGVLEENVYLTYGERQTVAVARGVDSAYQAVTVLREYVTDGAFELNYGTLDEVVVGRTLAYELGIRTAFVTPLELWFPSKSAEISLLDPQKSLNKVKLFPSGIVSLEQGFDKKYIFVPIAALQSLTESVGCISSLEIYASEDALNSKGIIKAERQKEVEAVMGAGFEVKNRYQQNDTVYKLLSYEKLAIYAILLFIVIIISCNIFGSLSMLIIEKQNDVKVLQALGASEKMTKTVFVKEGWMISLLGIAAGLAIGLSFCFIQQKFGIIKMPGNFIVDSYPVEVRFTDVLATVGGTALTGWLTAFLVRK